MTLSWRFTWPTAVTTRVRHASPPNGSGRLRRTLKRRFV